MDFIIFLEDFENGIRGLFKNLRPSQPKYIPYENSTSKRANKRLVQMQSVTNKLIEAIKEKRLLMCGSMNMQSIIFNKEGGSNDSPMVIISYSFFVF